HWCPGTSNARVCPGPDPRKALWPAALCAARTGRTHGCTDQPANVKKSLANSEPSTHGTKRTCQSCRSMSAFGGKADISQPALPIQSRFMNTRPDWQRFGCCGPLGIAVGQEQRPSDVPAWARGWSNRSHIKIIKQFQFHLAEGVGFEPTIRFPVYTLSKRAP